MNLQVEPPERKRKRKKNKTSAPPPPPSFPSLSLLPDEIAVNCLARISRAYYPRFSIISKSFRSLLSSMELYAARSHLGSTEQCLYVCLSDESYQSPQWFTLCINPNPYRNLTVRKLLAPIPLSDFYSVSQSTLVVGSEIYVIGGPVKTDSLHGCKWTSLSSTVRILDCRTHTWRDAPNMILARKHALAIFYDGKIYAMGGCGDDGEPWAEVFDIRTQTWEPLSDPGTEIRKIRRYTFYTIKEIKGNIYFWNAYKKCSYDTSQDSWKSIEGFQDSTRLIDGGVEYYYIPKSACVIDGVWYCIDDDYHFCAWTKDGVDWKGVKGLHSVIEIYYRNGGSSRNNTKLVNCGGKLLLLWEGYMKRNPSNMKKIWCAEITLKTDDEGEVWGNAEWIDVVQRVPIQCELLHCLVVSV